MTQAGQTSAGGAKRHIVHVFYSFGIGGSQMRLAAIIRALGDDFSHTIISLDGGFEAAEMLDPGRDVTMLTLPPEAPRGPLKRLPFYRRWLDALKPDLLVTYNWGGLDFVVANIGRRTPSLHVEDGFGPAEAFRQFRRRVWFRRFALRLSELAVPSATLKQIATRDWKLSPRRVHHIPNGIAEQDGWSTSLESLGLALPAGLPIVAWVGALRAEKNPSLLLRTYAPVKERAVLLIVGDGYVREAVEAEIAQGAYANVRLLGHRKDARDLVMQADMLVLSSTTEQMPLAVLEAMDAGLPVVSTDVGDVRRMVAAPNAPFVTSSEPDLAAALQRLVDDEALRDAVGEANRERCRDVYSLDKMVSDWRALFERLIARSASA